MKSKRLIEKQTRIKRDPEIMELIREARKSKEWFEVAHLLSTPRKNRVELNLNEIAHLAKEGSIIVVPGKVLSVGEVNKKIKISAFKFSEKAKQKLKEAKISFNSILEEIKTNPSAKGVQILK